MLLGGRAGVGEQVRGGEAALRDRSFICKQTMQKM